MTHLCPQCRHPRVASRGSPCPHAVDAPLLTRLAGPTPLTPAQTRYFLQSIWRRLGDPAASRIPRARLCMHGLLCLRLSPLFSIQSSPFAALHGLLCLRVIPNTVQLSMTIDSRNCRVGCGNSRCCGRFLAQLLIFLLMTRGLIRSRRGSMRSSATSAIRFAYQVAIPEWTARNFG